MALRTPLSVTPHLYMGDSTGRPLDKGVVYFGEQDKDPEFYPIELFSDDELTKPLMQPVHTKGGYLYDKGDMVEPHAKELIYSVKVLDSYGRKVFYKGAMMRNSWNDDVIEQINTALVNTTEKAGVIAREVAENALENIAIDANLVTDALVATVPIAPNTAKRNQASVNKDNLNALSFFNQAELASYQASPTGFDSTAALQRALFATTALGRKLNAYGVFKITDTIVISGSVDLGEVTLESYVIGKPAVILRPAEGQNYLQYADIKMPKLIKDNTKIGAGWSSNEGNTGVQAHNLISTTVRFGSISNFETNLHITAKNNRGCGYNEFHIGHLDNGKINLLVDDGDEGSGWCNENNFFGGRFSQNSGQGINITGCRHIALRSKTNTVNNNVFYKPCIEGDVPEFQVEFNASANTIHDARWECKPPKVLYKKNTGTPNAVNQGTNNKIDGGLYSDRIVFTNQGEGGSFTNTLIADGRNIYRFGSTTGGHRYMNGNGAGANVITVFNPSEVPSLESAPVNNYSMAWSSYYFDMKATSDVAPRIRLEAFRGRIYLGDGTATPTNFIDYHPAAGFRFSDGLWTTGGYNLGTTSYKWGNLYLSGAVGYWGNNPPATKPVVTGSRSDGTALASLLIALANYGLITDSTT